MFSTTLLCLALAPQGVQNPPVVINEFLYDDSSTDDKEFVELFNRSGASVDISGWVLDSEDPSGPNTPFTIPPGTVLPAGGFWTLGADAANPGKIDQVVGVSNIWENGNESLTLRDTTNKIIDTLVYEAVSGIWNPTVAEGNGIQGFVISYDPAPFSWQRVHDGFDTNDNGRDFFFAPMTPAGPNYTATVLPIVDNFDAAMPGDAVAGFQGSFVDPFVIDPAFTLAGGFGNGNPNSIAASPQGGNAMICWDPSGGGDACRLINGAVTDVSMEAWVYVDSTLVTAGEGETWNIGVRGAVDRYGYHTDPGNNAGNGTSFLAIGWSPGTTGVAVCFQRADNYANLWLLDYQGGGVPPTVLGTIPLTSANDGWQRMRFDVVGDQAQLTWGTTTVGGTVTSVEPGGIYVGYREHLINNPMARPPTFDDLTLRLANAVMVNTGFATPSKLGDPQVGMAGIPLLGSTPSVVGSNLIPNQAAVLAFGLPGVNIPIPGGIAGSAIQVGIIISPSIPTGANGGFSVPVPIPNHAGLLGFTIGTQIFDLDLSQPFPIPLAHSDVLTIGVGN